MNPTIEQVVSHFRRRREYRPFRYIDLAESRIVHAIQYSMDGWVLVIGHPNYGAYEWVVIPAPDFDPPVDPPAEFRRSDVGYGCSAAALRDGLKNATDDDPLACAKEVSCLEM
jgi:hypothetical protein